MKIKSGAAWGFLGKALTSLSIVITTALLARLLTQEEMASYFTIYSFVLIASSIILLGLNQAVLRMIPQSIQLCSDSNPVSIIFKSLFILTIPVSLFIFTLLLGQSFLANLLKNLTPISTVLHLTIAWTVARVLQIFVGEVYRGYQNIKKAVVFGGVLSHCMIVIYLYAILKLGKNIYLENVMQVVVVFIIISLLYPSAEVIRKRTRKLQPASKVRASAILSVSIPMWISIVSYTILMRIDIWVVALGCSSKQIAIYGAASELVKSILIMSSILAAFLPPLISELYYQGKKKRLEKLIRRFTTIAAVPGIFIFILFWIYGETILGLVYGKEYVQGYNILLILSVGMLVTVLSSMAGFMLNMTGFQNDHMLITVTSTILFIPISYLSLKHYGSIGVAYSLSFVIIIQSVFMVIAVFRRLNIIPVPAIKITKLVHF